MKKTQNGFVAIALAVVVLLAAAGGIYFYVKNNQKTVITEGVKVSDNVETTSDNADKINNTGDTKNVATTSITKSEVVKGTNDTVPAGKNDDLWAIFDKSVLALKNKDVASYNLYSYRQVSPDEESQFKDFAPVMYEQASKIKKSDYINKWQDDKQAIFSIDSQKTSTGYKIEQIMFVKKAGSWKFVTLSTKEFTGLLTPDSDKDGLTDSEETCTANHDPSCVKTDPNKRDTNGDGWWDGINDVIN